MRRIYGFGGSRYPIEIFLGPSKGSGSMLPQKILKMESLRFAKNAFPAYIEFSSVILNYAGKGFYRSIIRISHIFNHTISGKKKICH